MKISEFLRLRRQNDTVKLICLFALTGAVCLINAVYHLGNIYHDVNLPAEYSLTGEGVITQKQIDAFMEIQDMAEVSREMEIPVTIKYQGGEVMLECTMLSQEYMAEVYGMETAGSTKRYYMNEAAFDSFRQSLSESEASFMMRQESQSDGNREYDIQYSEALEISEEGDAVANTYKSAKLVVITSGIQQEESFFCTVENGSRLSREAIALRVLFQKHDLDGLHVSALRKMGYFIENEETVITEEYEIKMRLLHIRYGLLAGVICLVAVLALWHQVRKYVQGV